MTTVIGILLSFIGGSVLGLFYFWGLWKTVERMPAVRNPYAWMFASFLIRTILVVLGFYILLQLQWQFVAIALIGFILARMILVRRLGTVRN